MYEGTRVASKHGIYTQHVLIIYYNCTDTNTSVAERLTHTHTLSLSVSRVYI